jgi:polar amino acid transport system substrate-binding protein
LRTTAVFALLTFLTTAALGAEQVTIRADVWYPHNGEPNAATRGYMIEIADELFKAKGIAVNYDLMPWERALAMTRNGEIDCVVGAAHGDAPDFVFPSEPLGSDQSFAFVKKGNPWRYAGIESLGNVKIGVIEGYSYNEEADDYIKRNKNTPKVQSVTGDTPLEQNLRKLAAGRIDAVLESRPVFLATAEKLGLRDKFQDAGAVGEPNDLFIACSPKRESSKRFTQILSEGVPALRASGKLKTILSKYGLQDWK